MNSFRLFACFLAAVAAWAVDPAPRKPLVALKDMDQKEIKLGEDEEGCKDSALLPRVAGCSIIQCGNKEADTLDVVTSGTAEGVPQKESVDGPSEIIYYLCPSKTTGANIVKLSEAALLKAGYKAAFKGVDDDEHPLLTMQKGDEFVQISTYTYQNYSAYIQTSVKVVEAPVPPATADVILDDITTNNRSTLNGLTFNGEAITPEGEKVLAELQNVLEVKAAFKVNIEVHAAAGSEAAAEKRGAAVVAWLTGKGIDKARLTMHVAADGIDRVDVVKLP